MERSDADVSTADLPSIIELSPDEARRASSQAVTDPGVKRNADKLLEVRGLKTQFFTADGVIQAVDDVSFDVGYGETLGLVGESGCGKSVSALSIARLVPDPPGKIVAGQIMFDGIDILKLSNEAMRSNRQPALLAWLQGSNRASLFGQTAHQVENRVDDAPGKIAAEGADQHRANLGPVRLRRAERAREREHHDQPEEHLGDPLHRVEERLPRPVRHVRHVSLCLGLVSRRAGEYLRIAERDQCRAARSP